MTSKWTQVIPKLCRHKTSVIIQTSDYKVVCYKINSHYRDCAYLSKVCVGLEKSWTATGKDLPQEIKVTTQYLQTELVDKKLSGTFHFALWMEKAHIKKGPLISAETLGANSSWRLSIVQGFLLGTQIAMRMCAFYSKGNLSHQPSTILHILSKHTGSVP
jgi:hypothetical protein